MTSVLVVVVKVAFVLLFGSAMLLFVLVVSSVFVGAALRWIALLQRRPARPPGPP